jgi:predicted nucleotidyltransferase
VLLLGHEPTGIPIDLTLAWLPFERVALERAEPVDFGGVTIRVATAEDLVIYKAVAWRDRDRADVERLLVRHGREMDLKRLRAAVRQFAEALEEPERVEAFERLLHRALER